MSEKKLVKNPAYDSAYSDWMGAMSAYNAASSSMMSGGKNQDAVNVAKSNMHNAKSKLDSTPQYITVE